MSIEGLRGIHGPFLGGIEIVSNDALPSLNGLQGITEILGYYSGSNNGFSLKIEKNRALRSISALNNVHGDLAGCLYIHSNIQLESLEGIFGIRSAGRDGKYVGGKGVYINNLPNVCATEHDIQALRALCEATVEHGGKTEYCVPDNANETWWGPSCQGKFKRSTSSGSVRIYVLVRF